MSGIHEEILDIISADGFMPMMDLWDLYTDVYRMNISLGRLYMVVHELKAEGKVETKYEPGGAERGFRQRLLVRRVKPI